MNHHWRLLSPFPGYSKQATSQQDCTDKGKWQMKKKTKRTSIWVKDSHTRPSLTFRLHFFSHGELMKLSDWPDLFCVSLEGSSVPCDALCIHSTVRRQTELAIGLAEEQRQGGEQLTSRGVCLCFMALFLLAGMRAPPAHWQVQGHCSCRPAQQQ